MYDLLTNVLKLDVESKRVVVLLLQESILKDDALAVRIDSESDDNLATFIAMGQHGIKLKGCKSATMPERLLAKFILENPNCINVQKTQVVIVTYKWATDEGSVCSQENWAKQLSSLRAEYGITYSRVGRQHYWQMPDLDMRSNLKDLLMSKATK
jgi:hypothetical protein